MNNTHFFLSLLVISGSTYLIRALPFALLRKKIRNRFALSFLFYVPYAVLTAMTLPAALYATGSVIAAAIGLAVAILLSVRGKGLTTVAAAACVTVYVCELLIGMLPW
jgi:branched-subunit amino acid transport protein